MITRLEASYGALKIRNTIPSIIGSGIAKTGKIGLHKQESIIRRTATKEKPKSGLTILGSEPKG
jgi:hypothetical protein